MKKETQQEREARCHDECEAYYSLSKMTEQELIWFHKGINIGAKWVDSGDKIDA